MKLFSESLDGLQKQAEIAALASEAYAPLQAAAISFEVGKGLLKNDKK
jgi:hypothetical protein